MSIIIQGIQTVIAVLILFGVLLQQRAAGFASGVIGGTNIVQRRGAEKVLYKLTIVLSTAFMILSLVQLYFAA